MKGSKFNCRIVSPSALNTSAFYRKLVSNCSQICRLISLVMYDLIIIIPCDCLYSQNRISNATPFDYKGVTYITVVTI